MRALHRRVGLFFCLLAACGSAEALAQVAPQQQQAGRQAPPAQQGVRPANATAPAPQAGQAAPPGQAVMRIPGQTAPFSLTPAQQQLLDQILLKWEQSSAKVRSFSCNFTRWEYDPTFGNPAQGQQQHLRSLALGEIHFRSPDWGDFEVKRLEEWNGTRRVMEHQPDAPEHWRCDGTAIYEYDFRNRRLIQRTLPQELRGKAIADGPLPFVFGAKAQQLKDRYWLRDVTPRESVGKQVWIEAYPKRQSDAANVHHAKVILSEPDFRPFALQIYMPNNKNRTEYAFTQTKVNDPLFSITNLMPLFTPPGWKKVVDPEANEAGMVPPAQTQRPPAAATR